MSPLDTLPTEILSLVFQGCDVFSDVVSLASTCRTIQSVWLSESKIILWKVGCNDIIGFQYALTAVRAISIVEQAQKLGVLPPVIILQNLADQQLTLAELDKILNLRHLVRCFEHTFLLPKNEETCFYRRHLKNSFRYFVPPSDPSYLQLWSENFYIATYRVLVIGAVLSRVYQEPFFSLIKPVGFLERFLEDFVEGDYSFDHLTQEELNHLGEFPVYDLEAYENMGPLFDNLGDWLLEGCKSQIKARGSVDLEESNNSEGPLFREVARIMVICTHFCNDDNGSHFQYPDYAKLGFDRGQRIIDLSGPLRAVQIVPMGEFQVHEAKMCASVQAVETMLPHIRQLPRTEGPKIPMLPLVLEALYNKSGRPNYRQPVQGRGGPSPAPPLQIFEYILRKQFGLVFKGGAFEYYPEQPWERFRQAGDIFGDLSEITCPVESAFPPPALSYQSIS